jgi:hypothetical protein
MPPSLSYRLLQKMSQDLLGEGFALPPSPFLKWTKSFGIPAADNVTICPQVSDRKTAGNTSFSFENRVDSRHRRVIAFL